MRSSLPKIMLLIVIVFAVYGETLTHSFLVNWDDPVYVTQNPAVRGFSLLNVRTSFNSFFVGNYAPVQILSYMLDYTLWGENPFGYFLANLIYHSLSGILLYALLVRCGLSAWAALFGTAVFLVHPVQVESVAWISQRKNLLSMLLYLAAFHGYLNYREQRGRWLAWYWLSLLFLALALLAKSVAVIFPLMLILYDLLQASPSRSVKDQLDKVPYFVLAAAFGIITLISQDAGIGGGRDAYPQNPLLVIPLTMLPVLASYVKLVLLPLMSQLSAMYFPPVRDSIDAAVFGGFLLAGMLTAIGVYLYRTARHCLFWYLLFFLGLLPVSQIVPLITWMNDRYLYFPMIGAAGVAACLVQEVWLRFKRPCMRRGLVAVAVLLVIALSATTCFRARVWANSVFLFSDLVAKYPDQSASWARLAEAYVASGDLSLAQHYYEKAISLGPLDNDGIYNLAQIYFEKRLDSQGLLLIEALRSSGDRTRRDMLLLGDYNYRRGNYAAAEEMLLQFTAVTPAHSHGLYLLGQIYLLTGQTPEASEFYRKALAAGGRNARLTYSFACAETRLGNTGNAAAALQDSFANGLTVGDLQSAGGCLDDMKKKPQLLEIIRHFSAEE